MKRFAVVGAICLSFILGGMITAFAQDEHRDDKEVQQEERHDEHAERREEQRRIDDEHFRAHFGREHHFAIHHVTVVGGRPHFAYGGYSFEIVDAWPHGWSYNDNCYIDYVDGGYYLFDLRHPGVRIAVTVLP
jgi:hypothetical protein